MLHQGPQLKISVAAIIIYSALIFLMPSPTTAQGKKGAEKKLAELAKARYLAAKQVYEEFDRATKIIRDEERYVLSKRLLEAQRALDPSRQNQIVSYQAHRDRMKKVKRTSEQHFGARKIYYLKANFYYVEAEYWLQKAKSQMGKEDE